MSSLPTSWGTTDRGGHVQHQNHRTKSTHLRMSEAVRSTCRRMRAGSPGAAATCTMTASRSLKYSMLIRCAKRLSPSRLGASSGKRFAARASLIGTPAPKHMVLSEQACSLTFSFHTRQVPSPLATIQTESHSMTRCKASPREAFGSRFLQVRAQCMKSTTAHGGQCSCPQTDNCKSACFPVRMTDSRAVPQERSRGEKAMMVPVREAATKPEAVQCLRARKKISKSASSVSDCVRRRAAASALSAASLNAADTSSSPRPRRARFSFLRVLRDLCSR